MEQCSHTWNGEFEENCLCTKCSINHDWKETAREVVTEPISTSLEEELICIAYKCGMCGKRKEEKISFK